MIRTFVSLARQKDIRHDIIFNVPERMYHLWWDYKCIRGMKDCHADNEHLSWFSLLIAAEEGEM